MTADVQLPSMQGIPIHTNGSKAIIIIGYHAITVVIKLCGMCMWTSTDGLYMSACCLKCNSNGVSMAITATTECCLLRNVDGVYYYYYDILLQHYRVQCKR